MGGIWRIASSATAAAVVVGAVLLALEIAEPPLDDARRKSPELLGGIPHSAGHQTTWFAACCPFFFGPVFGVCDTALTTVGELAARAARVSGRLLLLCQW